MILKLLTGGIDLPKLASTVASLDLASSKTNAALADHIVNANARMTAVENVQSTNTAQCQIRMNGLQDLIGSRALAEDVETLKQRLERAEWDGIRDANNRINALTTTVAQLSAKLEALTAAKLSEVKARKAPKKDAAK